ncbi:pathogenesis-related protein 5-like [Canna indica]|uniref:Pathogenesis-related protein 5-like n=1 Tax=Canna indica TaxID=4628 RepID=A0AAQ3KDE9_9LILI|nr:pathogenesis-related protein 5-like [Canna indica]
MEASTTFRTLAFVPVLALLIRLSAGSSTFTISNNCPHTIWPGTLAGSGTPELPTTGFKLDSGQTARILAPPGWSGRIWARTECRFDGNGAGTCQTGDCGGRMECGGAGALPPVTLFEITLGKGLDDDFYDVSLVDGYNLPVIAAPRVLQGECNMTGCLTDLNRGCPKELQVQGAGEVVACKSACEAFGLDKYCCSGEFATATSCKPSFYSNIFKAACPRAYSYAFDDATSTFTCKAYDYTIIFCPNDTRLRSSHNYSVSPPSPTNEGNGDEGEPAENTSSASNLSFHVYLFLLLLILLVGILQLLEKLSYATATATSVAKVRRIRHHRKYSVTAKIAIAENRNCGRHRDGQRASRTNNDD